MSSDMRWHKEKHVMENNVFRHPADSSTWKEFDNKHPWFAAEPRNVRLGLASDGFNPFGNMSNSYSMWPVMVFPYNLPPWKCMKEPYIFMSLLIPGPRSPGKEIDVYLRPLIDELKELWVDGISTYDATTNRTFTMHATLLWTINDFPAYGDLSGWVTKGYMACPVCNSDSSSTRLMHGKKICWFCHRRWLPLDHKWRNWHKQFDGKKESRQPPKISSGDELIQQLQRTKFVDLGKLPTNKKRKRTGSELNWTKQSIFFELSYWQGLKLRHNLDVMHIEKNICDNILSTLMNIDGKTKDTMKSRLDLQVMGIRKELHLISRGDKFLMPPACYTLSKEKKKSICEWLKAVKLPDGYGSNISRCVNKNNCTLSGLKSHDCHILLQCLLLVAICGHLSNTVCNALVELGLFFKELCCKTLKLEVLEKLEKDIVSILCKLEMIFPPSFFDVMVHLAIHLPREAIIAGPTQYRWMYPIERFLRTLKQYVRNKARPEGSIAEAYVDNECAAFFSLYLRGVETRFNREERNCDRAPTQRSKGFSIFMMNVRPLGSGRYELMNSPDLEKAHFYVLNNCPEVTPFLRKHMEELEKEDHNNIHKRNSQQFSKWFEVEVKRLRHSMSPTATDDLYSLACGPDSRVKRYMGCVVNGTRFHTKEREKNRKTQNSGVMVKGENIEFYGCLTDIIEVSYDVDRKVFLFRCDWCNTRTGVQKDQYFTSVNLSRKAYKDEPFVLAQQAKQVLYLKDNKLKGEWEVVQQIDPRNLYDVLEKNEEPSRSNEEETPEEVAYQDFESTEVNGVVRDTDLDSFTLTNVNLIADEIDYDAVQKSLNDANVNNASNEETFNLDDDTSSEEAASSNACSDEEDFGLSDDDTDIE